jgi:hypothetical protein
MVIPRPGAVYIASGRKMTLTRENMFLSARLKKLGFLYLVFVVSDTTAITGCRLDKVVFERLRDLCRL